MKLYILKSIPYKKLFNNYESMQFISLKVCIIWGYLFLKVIILPILQAGEPSSSLHSNWQQGHGLINEATQPSGLQSSAKVMAEWSGTTIGTPD